MPADYPDVIASRECWEIYSETYRLKTIFFFNYISITYFLERYTSLIKMGGRGGEGKKKKKEKIQICTSSIGIKVNPAMLLGNILPESNCNRCSDKGTVLAGNNYSNNSNKVIAYLGVSIL